MPARAAIHLVVGPAGRDLDAPCAVMQVRRAGREPGAPSAFYQGSPTVANQVVARFLDGSVLKGMTLDVDPSRDTFHIRPPARQNIQVRLSELKALFFVRDLTGDPKRVEGMALEPEDTRARGAHPIEVEFADGERVVGLTVRYPPVRPYFYVLPADDSSNNIRILVNRSAVVRMSQPRTEAA